MSIMTRIALSVLSGFLIVGVLLSRHLNVVQNGFHENLARAEITQELSDASTAKELAGNATIQGIITNYKGPHNKDCLVTLTVNGLYLVGLDLLNVVCSIAILLICVFSKQKPIVQRTGGGGV